MVQSTAPETLRIKIVPQFVRAVLLWAVELTNRGANQTNLHTICIDYRYLLWVFSTLPHPSQKEMGTLWADRPNRCVHYSVSSLTTESGSLWRRSHSVVSKWRGGHIVKNRILCCRELSKHCLPNLLKPPYLSSFLQIGFESIFQPGLYSL
jgi:hypothetical protein